MTMVGIRELKAHLSAYLKRVKKGEAIAVSEHGKEVALMTPSGKSTESSKAWDLVRQRKVDWNGGVPNLKKRTLIKIKGNPLSKTVIDLRKEERY